MSDSSAFKPHPYTFRLIDYYDSPMNVHGHSREKIIAHCPPFHILLDHTIAVLWMLFSPGTECNLRSSQIGWAHKFLEGMHNDFRGKFFSDDVLKATRCLECALINYISTEASSKEAALQEDSMSGQPSYFKEASENEEEYEDDVAPPIQLPPNRENELQSLFLRDMLEHHT